MCPGSIVLFHNAALHTPEALPSVLEHMIREGYTVVPIGQLIYTENYTIDQRDASSRRRGSERTGGEIQEGKNFFDRL